MGVIKGSMYFSDQMPEGKFDVKYNKEDWKLFKAISSPNATKATTRAAQTRLHQLGLLEEDQVDGNRGPITDGAIKRYMYMNAKEPLYEKMRDAGDWIQKAIYGE